MNRDTDMIGVLNKALYSEWLFVKRKREGLATGFGIWLSICIVWLLSTKDAQSVLLSGLWIAQIFAVVTYCFQNMQYEYKQGIYQNILLVQASLLQIFCARVLGSLLFFCLPLFLVVALIVLLLDMDASWGKLSLFVPASYILCLCAVFSSSLSLRSSSVLATIILLPFLIPTTILFINYLSGTSSNYLFTLFWLLALSLFLTVVLVPASSIILKLQH